MSRHRNVRSMNYEDEYYDDDDVYGHSVEENYCISPGTAAQFTYNRDSHVELSNYMGEVERIPEEDEDDENDGLSLGDSHRNSFEYKRPPLSDLDNAKLNSCLEEVRNVLGDTVPEHILIDTIMKHGYSVDLTLNELLNQQDAPKPQREKRENRRNRSQEYYHDLDPDPDTGVNPKTPQTACTDLSHDNIFSYILPHLGGNMKFGPDSSNKLPEVDNESDKMELITDTLESAVILSDNTKTEKKKPHMVSKTENAQRLLSQPNTHDEQTAASNHKNDHSSTSYSDISRSLSGLILSHKVTTSSKSVTKSYQNISGTHNANKVIASSGMSLAELSKIHGSNNQSFKSLSELRNIDKESKGINTGTESSIKSSGGVAASKQHLCGASLSDLAETQGQSCIKQAEMETLQGQKPFSLQNLAREHEKKVSKTNQPQGKFSGPVHGDPENTMAARTREIDKRGPSLADLSNTTLADLAKQNTRQNQNTPSITSLSQLSNSSDSLISNFGKGPNNETRHETGITSTDLAEKGAVHKRKETSLSDLMKPCIKPAKEGQKTFVFSGQTSLSLADLAKAHGVIKKEPDTLLTLGHTNSVEKTGKATGYHVGANTKSQTKPELAPGLKVKDTKTVMDSLSSRIDSFAGIEVRQQAAYGPIRSKIKHPENPSLGSQPEYSVPLILGTKSKNSLCGRIGPQLAYLASKDDCKDTSDRSVNKKSNLTLADLAKPVEEVKGKVTNIQESDIKEHTNEQGNEKSSGPSKDALATQNLNCMKRDDKSNAETDLDVGCTVFEEISLLNSNEFFTQNFDQILACPSVLGKIICLSMRLKEKSVPFYRNKYFKYGNQMKSVRRVEKSISRDVNPFDFSTPSPDDIVQSRQKLAFTRSGNRQ